jgi:hypothetical protein
VLAAAGKKSSVAEFDRNDPLGVNSLLTDEERMIQEQVCHFFPFSRHFFCMPQKFQFTRAWFFFSAFFSSLNVLDETPFPVYCIA